MSYRTFYLIYLVTMIMPLSSLKIIQSPNHNVWVEEGKNVSLLCSTDHPWQWCYWEREISNNKSTYQIVQAFTTLDTYDPSIKFTQLQETSCGIQIIGASTGRHQVHILLVKVVYLQIW